MDKNFFKLAKIRKHPHALPLVSETATSLKGGFGGAKPPDKKRNARPVAVFFTDTPL